MAGTINLVFTITKKMYKAIKAGEAFLESGGVRNTAGQILELAKPAAKAASSISLSPISLATSCVNMASSLASNVQCAYIQKGVNEANIKLDKVMESMTGIIGSLQKVQALSWVTSAFSLANCGISVTGFYLTMQKINSVHGELRAFIDRYMEDKKNDTVQFFDEHIGHLLTDLSSIQNVHKNETYGDKYFNELEGIVSDHIDACIPFLKRTKSELMQNSIDSKLACQIIFTLSSILLETINEFCSAYFYVHHNIHGRYNEWMRLLKDMILNDDFKAFMKRHIMLDAEYADMLPKEKNAAIDVVFDSIARQTAKVETCRNLITEISEGEFADIDNVLNQRIYCQLSEQFEKDRDESLDRMLMDKIVKYEMTVDAEDDDLLAISID